MTRVAVIADSHNLLRTTVVEWLRGADEIWHAGDLCNGETLRALNAIKPTLAVRGNNDRGAWAEALPGCLSVQRFSQRIYLIHQRQHIPADLRADLVICGHSHKPSLDCQRGLMVLNPGAIGPRRFKLPISSALLDITADGLNIQHVEFPSDAR